jgi:hypothetical protein
MHYQQTAINEARPMTNLLTTETLRKENLAFVRTGGVSAENRSSGFRAAFYDLATGRAELARFADGRPAPMHLLEGLPDSWVAKRDAQGRASAIKNTVIAGFIRDGFFYTREQAAAAAVH